MGPFFRVGGVVGVGPFFPGVNGGAVGPLFVGAGVEGKVTRQGYHSLASRFGDHGRCLGSGQPVAIG